MGKMLNGVIRSKGYFWLCNDQSGRYEWSTASDIISIKKSLWADFAIKSLTNPEMIKKHILDEEGQKRRQNMLDSFNDGNLSIYK